MRHPTVTAIEVTEDFSATARCDEGFLHLRRLRARNRRDDGSASAIYRIDMVDRPRLDAVAVLVYRRVSGEPEFLTHRNLRPAAYFRKDKKPVVPDGHTHLFVEEIVAGLLEPGDEGERGLRTRAAAEVFEEAGYRVRPESVELLGPPFLVAPGIISEKIFLLAADVTGLEASTPPGDGSPLEEGGVTTWWTSQALLTAIDRGEIQDAKTELAVRRFLSWK